MSAPLLAAKLIELRHEHNLCQQDVADVLGMTREGYCHYERNTREPNLEILMRLCQFYQIEISELINTTLIPVPSVSSSKAAPQSTKEKQSPVLLQNINHMLKLFSGKYASSFQITDITKKDLDLLTLYKKLSKKDQKEITDFIQFKLQRSSRPKC